MARHGGDVLHHQLARLGLPGAALPREDDGLVLAPGPQLMPRPVSQGVTDTKIASMTDRESGDNSATHI